MQAGPAAQPVAAEQPVQADEDARGVEVHASPRKRKPDGHADGSAQAGPDQGGIAGQRQAQVDESFACRAVAALAASSTKARGARW